MAANWHTKLFPFSQPSLLPCYHHPRFSYSKIRRSSAVKNLWFKAIYVSPILSGEKCHTVRAKDPMLRAGQRFTASVGPRSPFALLEATVVVHRPALAYPKAEREENARYYPGVLSFVEIEFRLVRDLRQGTPY